jgi:tRNA(fMet)-specific endonuclease VapC
VSLRFLLDTDTVSFAFRGQGSVAKRLAAAARSNVGISAVTLAELRFGASRRNSTRLHSFIDEFTANVRVLPFDADAARHFGLLAAALADVGTPIGQLDTMIAAHALALDVALVSNNTWEPYRLVAAIVSGRLQRR